MPATPKKAAKKPAAKAAKTPEEKPYTVRVRMYRQGLGDCHLITIPRKDREPFQMLIDFGALNRDTASMLPFAEEIEKTTLAAGATKGRIDVVVATHEHKDHLSGFNQARAVFDRMDIGSVWLGWTENPADDEARELTGKLGKAEHALRAAAASPRLAAAAGRGALENVRSMLGFSGGDDTGVQGQKTIADALAYLRKRGQQSGSLRYLEPGAGPLELDGVEGVKVYVLGPPRQRELLLRSEVTKDMKDEDIVYHLASGQGEAAMAANCAALAMTAEKDGHETDPFQPFAAEHRLQRDRRWWSNAKAYYAATYDEPSEEWRKIDDEWLGAFDQLALKLANDTNNTSLVLAFEITATKEVLLFVGDAQVGNWQSWAGVEFNDEATGRKFSGQDLLSRTVFYKVGHHASHNATLKKGGLDLMRSPRLVGFIPLDKATAAMQGRIDPVTNKPKGWQMPAKALFEALQTRTQGRLVISDVKEPLPQKAAAAGVSETDLYVEWRL